MYKFNINGTDLVDLPDGWQNITSSIKRDEETGFLLLDANISLKFFAGQDGYTILKSAWDANKYGESHINIYQKYPDGVYRMIHSGTIFHSSIKFEIINQNLSFKTEDRGFYAMINNNKKIDVDLGSIITKNKQPLTACPNFTLTVHNVNNGNPKHNVKAYKIIDVLKYMVSFMTDNRMTLQASCFESGGVFEGICLVNGHELAVHDGTIRPIITWETLTKDLVKRLNVQFSVIGSIDNPIINVETYGSFYAIYNSLQIDSIPSEVTVYTDENKLYSCVEVGSRKTETDSNLHFPDVYALTSFRSESFHFIGTNNIDRKLDLVGDLVISNASIEVVVSQLSGWEGYEQDTFMIQYNVASNTSYQSNWVGSTIAAGFFYNEMFNNQNILNRWSNALPNEISITSFNPSINSFLANGPNMPTSIFTEEDSNGGVTLETLIGFKYDYPLYGGYDPSNNYGGPTAQNSDVSYGNSYFTAPVNGFYSFAAAVKTRIDIWLENILDPLVLTLRWRDKNFAIRLTKMDSSGNTINTSDGPAVAIVDQWIQQYNLTNHLSDRAPLNREFWIHCAWGTFMNAGEKMKTSYIHWVSQQTSQASKEYYKITPMYGYFRCDNIQTGGGVISPADPIQYKSLKLDFEYPLNLDLYRQLLGSKNGLVQVPINNLQKLNGWVQNVSFDHGSGMTKFSLITDGNTIYR